MSAFNDGYEAYKRGDDDWMNPYDDNDMRCDECEDGWYTAQEDRLR